MGISFGSIATGLPKDIVKQIIAADKIPVKKMEENKAKLEEKKQLVSTLMQLTEEVRGNLATMGNARSLREFAIQTNEDLIGVTADKNIAQPGSYQFEVTNLARKSSALSSGFEDPDDSYVGVGFIQYILPDGTDQEVFVDADNSSLNGLAKLINGDPSLGMRAHVVNDHSGSDSPYRLLISLKDTGDTKKAHFPYFYFVDGEQDFYLEFEREARDAKIKLDGFELELPENKTSELIPGLTIDLKKADPGTEFSIVITEDTEAVSEKISVLIDNVNNVLDFIKVQNTLDEKTDTSRTLGGDLVLQTLESRIRTAVFQPINTEFGALRMSDLGVTFQRDGKLQLDTEKFDAVLAKDYKRVSQVLTGRFDEDGQKIAGFLDTLNKTVNGALRIPNGILTTRKNGIQSKMDLMDRRIADKERVIKQKETNLKNKFARLEETVSRIKSQGAGVAALGGAAQVPTTQLGQTV